jgi:hypothetical protein
MFKVGSFSLQLPHSPEVIAEAERDREQHHVLGGGFTYCEDMTRVAS